MSLDDEIRSIRDLSERQATKGMKPLLESYKRALSNVRGDIASLLMDYTVDGALSASKKQRYSILKALEKQLRKQTRELGAIDIEVTTNILNDLYSESYYRSAYILEKGVTGLLSFAVLNPELVKSAVNTPIKGEMFSDRIWSNKAKLVQRVRHTVERALIEGKDPAKLSRDIKREFGRSTYESTRLVQNEVSRVTRNGQDEIYKQNSYVVGKVMFDATLDNKTSEFCQEHDGREYSIDENKPDIPSDTHVGCRSDYIPIVRGWKPSKKRENVKVNGEKRIIDYTTYDKWKETRLSE